MLIVCVLVPRPEKSHCLRTARFLISKLPLTMVRITMIEHSSEQTSRMRRLSHWLCIPFRRAPPSSYIDPTPPVRQTEQAEIPVLTSPAQLQQLNRGNNVLIINDKTLDNDRRPRSRYRPARPQSRVPTYQSLDTRQPGKDKLGYASRSCDRAITRQEGTLSANSNAHNRSAHSRLILQRRSSRGMIVGAETKMIGMGLAYLTVLSDHLASCRFQTLSMRPILGECHR